jgi:hypothetical protein
MANGNLCVMCEVLCLLLPFPFVLCCVAAREMASVAEYDTYGSNSLRSFSFRTFREWLGPV